MENEVPKVEEAKISEETKVSEASVAKTEAAETSAETITPTPKPSLMVKMKGCVSKMSRTTKSFIIALAVFAVIFGGLYYYRGVFIAAIVNGSPISRLSVVQELEKKGGKNVLDTIITKKLIQDEMKKAGIVVKSEDIDAEMKKIETQVTAQGGTLEDALVGQGMTLADLREQITINKELELMLADKIAVSDDEVNQYLSTSKTPAPKGVNSEDLKNQAREQLKSQKFSTEASKWLDAIKAKANIQYLTQYE